ncbi:hypothetical protein [uncultured Cyclobacterium sp.]|uniref:hypothetical protein n=1 Tax=uncultured Cyclobacterium sp. TaxID=453820 RepID=UPI0030EC4AAC|tara:strand:+ start:375237 stop:375866 length:630 start_codon:yes stop_codon:yes gene_type:complete
MKKISLSVLISCLLILSGKAVVAQQVEISGGLTQKVLLGEEKDVFNPALGYEFGLNHHVNDYRMAHSLNYGLNFGIFNLNRVISEEGYSSQYQQLFETKALFRYDYFIYDYLSLFSGGEAGFQFINLKSDQKVVISSQRATKVFSKAIIAPQIGVNFELSPNLAIYYKLTYDLGYYLGDQPDWGGPTSKWSYLLTNSAGVRVKFRTGYY